MATTANFSQSELVELVWTNRNAKTFSLKKKELQAELSQLESEVAERKARIVEIEKELGTF